VARRKRMQNGWLFKYGKRRKVWVGRWREDALVDGGKIERVHKSLVLGSVVDLPTRLEAQTAGRDSASGQSRHEQAGIVGDVRDVRRRAMESAGAPYLQGVNAAWLQDRAERACPSGMA